MTEKERELIDAGMRYAKFAKTCLLASEEPTAIGFAAEVLDAATAVYDERQAQLEAPLPTTYGDGLPMRREAGEVLPLEARASWARGCAGCALDRDDIAHTCGAGDA